MKLKKFEGKNKEELALINVAHEILNEKGGYLDFNELVSKAAEYLNYSDEQLEAELPQFYTDLNIDGRFISLGENRWGIREWYAMDSINEELTNENNLEDIQPKISEDGFDDYGEIEEEYAKQEEIEEENKKNEESDDDDSTEYGEVVDVDEHGVLVDEEDDESLGEYKEDIDDIDEEDDEELKGLSVVDDEDVLSDEEDDEEEDEEDY